MADMNDVRDELFRAGERIVNRQLTTSEKEKLIESFNNPKNSGTIFDKCSKALEEVLNVNLEVRVILEKSASVDQVRNALDNLRNIAAQSAKKR